MNTRFIRILYLALVAIFSACSSKSDEEFRAEEQVKLKEFLNEDLVLYYKGMKTFARFTIAKNQQQKNLPYQQEFDKLETSHLQAVALELTTPVDSTRKIDLVDEVVTYYQAYQEFNKLKDLLQKVEEDSLPTFCELLLSSNDPSLKIIFGGQDVRSVEHLLLGTTIYLPQKLPQTLVLYELTHVDMEKLGTNDIRGVAQSVKGMLLSQYKFPYLSEWEHSENIEIMESQNFTTIALSPVVPYTGNVKITDQERSRLELHAVNLLGRALARMGMDRDDKKELAIEDCEAFLKDAEKLGWDNELVWLCGTYVALHKEDQERALMYLKKLEKSPLLDAETKVVVTESIKYLEKRDPEQAFVGISDKAFIARLSLNLALTALEKSGIIEKMQASGNEKFKEFNDKLAKQSESLKKIFKVDQIKETEEELLKKAKNIF